MVRIDDGNQLIEERNKFNVSLFLEEIVNGTIKEEAKFTEK